jgi:hypothetical protein
MGWKLGLMDVLHEIYTHKTWFDPRTCRTCHHLAVHISEKILLLFELSVYTFDGL